MKKLFNFQVLFCLLLALGNNLCATTVEFQDKQTSEQKIKNAALLKEAKELNYQHQLIRNRLFKEAKSCNIETFLEISKYHHDKLKQLFIYNETNNQSTVLLEVLFSKAEEQKKFDFIKSLFDEFRDTMKEIINLRTIFNVLKNNEMLTFVGTLTDAINFNIENTQLREALHHCIKAVENTITKAVSTPEDKVEDLVKPTSAIEKNAWFTNDDLRSIQKINWAYYNALCNSDINKVKRDKLFRAARKCHIPEFDQEYDIKDVRLLIHQDNGYAPTVLHDAIISYDVNQKTITNVYDFIKNLKHEILNIVNYSQPLLQKAVTSTRYSLTPLDLALIKTKQNPDFIKICKLLLEKGARININSYEKIKWNKNPKEAQRRTQLAYAVSNNSVTVVSLLLDYVKIENINNEERRNLTDLVQQRIQKQNVDNVDEAKSIEKLLNKMFTDAPPASNLTSAGAAKTAQQQAPVKVVRATASSAAAEVPVTGERTPPGTQPSSITASSETIGQKEAGLSNCSQANLSTQESIQLPAPNKISVPQPPQVQEQKQSYNIERPKKARVIKVIERVIKLKQMEKVKFLNFQTGKFKINKIRGQKNKMIKAPLMIISQMCLLHQKINRIGLKVLP